MAWIELEVAKSQLLHRRSEVTMSLGQRIAAEERAAESLSALCAKYGIQAPAHAIEDMVRSDFRTRSFYAHSLHHKIEKDLAHG